MRDILREIIPSITTGLCRDRLRKNRRIGVEPFSASETEDRTQKPVGNDFRPFIVPKSETAAVVRQNRNIRLIADLESAYAIGEAQHLCRINRDHGDHVLERKTQRYHRTHGLGKAEASLADERMVFIVVVLLWSTGGVAALECYSHAYRRQGCVE